MKKSILLLAILFSFKTFAQNYVDIISLSWDEGFQNDYGMGNQRGRFTEWNADITLPLVLSDKVALLTGITSEGIELAFDSESLDDIKVYGVGIKLGLNIKHSDKWSGTYLSIPKLSADEMTFSSRNFQVGWIGLLKRTISTNRNYKIGFYTNSEIFGPFLVPLLGYYAKTSNWEINIMAPLSAQVEYLFTDRIKTGLHFKGIIKSYELNKQPGYLTKANNEISLANTVSFGKVVWMTNIGTTLGRNVRIYPDDSELDFALSALKVGDDRIQQNEDLADGLFIKTSLILRFSTL